jgi:hypothetical protein
MYHIDLSLWAFEKMADLKWGVISLEWRDVACSYKPALQARSPFGRTPMPDNYKPRPGGWGVWGLGWRGGGGGGGSGPLCVLRARRRDEAAGP